ncbi:MAG: histidine kinase, partial [Lachnospiraceae bacterium]|nr:histidine kinase [Lachnospiraceae bacterium]
NIEIYANNPTIINGGYLKRLSAAEDKTWYREFKNSGRTASLCCYYIGNEEPTATRKKRITLIRNMDYFRNSVRQKVVKVDIDYTPLVRKVTDMKYPYDMYLCIGDKIILSTVGHNGVGEDFDHLTGDETIGIENEWNIYGQNFRILIARPRVSELGKLSDYSGGLVAVILLNIALPFILISFINQSFENRIGRQQADIARQNAELLAMQSQINPHFLFNVLESVRMHSVLKSEHETASMIEKLAVLVRQNVNWKDDETSIEDEVKFIEDYLLLQKYRFGDKLSYEIELADECRSLMIPRLTLVTFVENSCVHGMERKTSPSWIYVRIYIRNEELVMEIEDTGSGMDENEATQLCDHMNNAVIDDLKKNNHIGVINACIRLKIYTDSRAKFELESEEGVGTFTVIKVPVDSLGVGRKEEADES